uniref:Tripartite motif containing 109 n=1 Tax=Astyanax mexicanus TaxID=7994 RepID=A0A8B9RDJ9_ASTMX
MDSRLSKQIQCSVCLGDFVDPVSLLCDHTFCRQCIGNHSQSSRGLRLCPECRRPYTMWDLRSNRVLRNMVDAVREHLSEQQSLRDRGASAAGTDRTTTGPVLESEMLLCPEHDERLKLFCETDQQLVCLICRDGDNHQGHKFKPVDEAAGPKKYTLALTTHSRISGVKLTPVEFIRFINCSFLLFEVKSTLSKYMNQQFPDRNVISDCHDPYLRVSSDGRSVTRTAKKGLFYRQRDYRPLARTHKTFQSGQHYWEVDVGEKRDWSVGVDEGCISNTNKDIRLQLKHSQGYCVKENGTESDKELSVKPRRIGLYLDCDRRQVCFYNADDMTLLHSSVYASSTPYSLSLSPGVYLQDRNADPLTVCWN